MHEIICQFAAEYGLTRSEVIAEIERTLSSVLSRWYKRKVVVVYSQGIKASIYDEANGEIMQKELDLTKLRGWNTIIRILRTNMMEISCRNEIRTLKRHEREMRWGEIVRRDSDGSLHVEIEIEDGCPITAICPSNRIGIHEHDHLTVGQRRAFHIRRIDMVMFENVPRIVVIVDRVSKTLVENLLKSKVDDDVHIRCVKRYVGHKSIVVSSRRLPREAIIAVDRELREGIEVKLLNGKKGKCHFRVIG